MLNDYSDEEIKADIMHKLMRKGCWGAKYLPLESLVRWLSKKIGKDGRRVRRLIKELVKEGYLLAYKGGKAISLNPLLSSGIIEYIERMIE